MYNCRITTFEKSTHLFHTTYRDELNTVLTQERSHLLTSDKPQRFTDLLGDNNLERMRNRHRLRSGSSWMVVSFETAGTNG